MRAMLITVAIALTACGDDGGDRREMSPEARNAALERAMASADEEALLEPLTRADGEAIALDPEGCDFIRPTDGAVLLQAGRTVAWARSGGATHRYVADAGASLLAGPAIASRYDSLGQSLRIDVDPQPIEAGIGAPRYEAVLTLENASGATIDRATGILRCRSDG